MTQEGKAYLRIRPKIVKKKNEDGGDEVSIVFPDSLNEVKYRTVIQNPSASRAGADQIVFAIGDAEKIVKLANEDDVEPLTEQEYLEKLSEWRSNA